MRAASHRSTATSLTRPGAGNVAPRDTQHQRLGLVGPARSAEWRRSVGGERGKVHEVDGVKGGSDAEWLDGGGLRQREARDEGGDGLCG